MRHRRHPLSTAMTLVELLVVLAIIGILVTLLLPAVQAAREASRQTTCRSQLRQLALATLNYSTAHNEYLPALWRTDRPKVWDNFSWRVTLLPYLEQETTYNQLNLQASPISTNNALALGEIVGLFQCPSTPDAPRTTRRLGNRDLPSPLAVSDYAAIHDVKSLAQVYPLRGAWNGGPDLASTLPPPPDILTSDQVNPSLRIQPGNLRWITDGLSQTVLLTEQAGRPLSFGPGGAQRLGELSEGAWGTAESGSFRGDKVNQDNAGDPYGFHRGVAVALCDGSVHLWPTSIHRELIMTLLSRDGHEIVDPSDWR